MRREDHDVHLGIALWGEESGLGPGVDATASRGKSTLVSLATSVASVEASAAVFGFNFQLPPINGRRPSEIIDRLRAEDRESGSPVARKPRLTAQTHNITTRANIISTTTRQPATPPMCQRSSYYTTALYKGLWDCPTRAGKWCAPPPLFLCGAAHRVRG